MTPDRLPLGAGEQTTVETLRQRNFEDAEKIQGERQHDYAEAENEISVGELKAAPGQISASGFENNKKQCQRDKPRKNSSGKSESASKDFLPALAGLFNETENFE